MLVWSPIYKITFRSPAKPPFQQHLASRCVLIHFGMAGIWNPRALMRQTNVAELCASSLSYCPAQQFVWYGPCLLCKHHKNIWLDRFTGPAGRSLFFQSLSRGSRIIVLNKARDERLHKWFLPLWAALMKWVNHNSVGPMHSGGARYINACILWGWDEPAQQKLCAHRWREIDEQYG